MHRTICSRERKQRRDEPDEETQAFAFISSFIEEERPDVFGAGFGGRHDGYDDEHYDEERDVQKENGRLDVRKQFREIRREERREDDDGEDDQGAVPAGGYVGGLAVDDQALQGCSCQVSARGCYGLPGYH